MIDIEQGGYFCRGRSKNSWVKKKSLKSAERDHREDTMEKFHITNMPD